MRPKFVFVWMVAASWLICSCAPAPNPKDRPVARVDDRVLTVADVEEYLGTYLPSAPDEEPAPVEELDVVRSRLFDDFVEEQILLREAERQGIVVSAEEVQAYLRSEGEEGADTRASEERLREKARRQLTVQKLRERSVRGKVSVTPDEVDAYLERNRELLAAGRHVVLRSLLLSSEEQAKVVARELTGGRMSFAQAVSAANAGPGQGESLEVDLDNLPAAVRGAVERLSPGQISEPVVVNDRVYLFLVDAWIAPASDEEHLHALARAELLQRKQEEASRAISREIRSRMRIEVETRNLPFRYVPEPES